MMKGLRSEDRETHGDQSFLSLAVRLTVMVIGLRSEDRETHGDQSFLSLAVQLSG